MLTALFVCVIFVDAQSETRTPENRQMPGINLEKIYGETEAFDSYGQGYGKTRHDGCDKCKKSKKHGACNQPGKHYGKHKKRGSGKHSCCKHNQNRSCGGNDRWSDRNSRDRRNDRWGNDNPRDRRDNTRYGSEQRDNDRQYRGGASRTSQRRVNGNSQVKTNRPGAARRVGTRQ